MREMAKNETSFVLDELMLFWARCGGVFSNIQRGDGVDKLGFDA